MKKTEIYPAILTDNPRLAQQQLNLAKQLGVPGVQVDVLDGYYADNVTLSPVDWLQFDLGQLKLDFHLMVDEPMDFLYEMVEIKGQLQARAVVAQIEKMSHPNQFIEEAKRYQFLAGLSLDLFTPFDQLVETLDDLSWQELDIVQVMGVKAGFQQQRFHREALKTVEAALAFRQQQSYRFKLMVDGGINLDTLPLITRWAVDAVVVGSALWQATDIKSAYTNLTKASGV